MQLQENFFGRLQPLAVKDTLIAALHLARKRFALVRVSLRRVPAKSPVVLHVGAADLACYRAVWLLNFYLWNYLLRLLKVFFDERWCS